MFKNGYGVKQDFVEAVRWYRKAAEQGDVEHKTTSESFSRKVKE